MNKKTVVNLLLVALGLFILYWLSYTDTRQKKSVAGRELLFSEVSWSDVESIELHKEGDSITLDSGAEGSWFLPSRGNYPANISSIRSFLLKLMDLSSSQSIETTEEGMKKMGLDEMGGEASKGAVVLKNREGKEIETLYLGSLRTRKGASEEDTLSLSGQFVRLGSKNEVYLVSLPVSISTDIGSWIDKSVLKLDQSLVYRVASYVLQGDKEILKYTINRVSSLTNEAEPEYSFSQKAPRDKEISQTVVRQVTMALEDLKADDVYLREDTSVGDFSPKQVMRFFLTNGLVYEVRVQETDGACFISIEVNRDQALVEELSGIFEKEKVSKTEAPDEFPEESEKGDSEEAAQEASTQEEENQVFQVVTEDEVLKERERLGKWVYVVPDFVGKKFMKEVEVFFKEIAKEEGGSEL